MNREEMRLNLQSASDKLKEVFDRLKVYTTPYYDLKLHEIAVESDKEDFDKYFDDFCEINYLDFEDFLSFHDVVTCQVGRTSSFALTTKYLNDIDDDDEFKYFVETLAQKVCSDPDVSYELAEVNDALLDHIEESIANDTLTEEDVDEDVEDLLAAIPDIEESIKDLKAVDDYITNFKANQLSYWNDYVDMRKEDEELDAE